jgi:Periplasmic binding protein
MRARLGLAAVAVALALAAGGCGGSAEPIRIGVLSDCFGFFGAYNDIVLAGLELPLLERGARLAGRKPSDGIVGAKVAGRPDRVACTGTTFFNTLIEQTRRLVEIEGVDVVIGPTWGPTDGFVLRDVAERYPDVAFVPGVSLAPEETLRDPAPNLFRFTPDYAQQTAGLGNYAYRELGWRTAAIVASDWSPVWPRVAGFAAEFCALGGRILDPMWRPGGAPIGAEVAASVPRDVDGVALFPASSFLDWSGFARGSGSGVPTSAGAWSSARKDSTTRSQRAAISWPASSRRCPRPTSRPTLPGGGSGGSTVGASRASPCRRAPPGSRSSSPTTRRWRPCSGRSGRSTESSGTAKRGSGRRSGRSISNLRPAVSGSTGTARLWRLPT